MLDQARAEFPNECCGLLGGTLSEGRATIAVRYPIRNELMSPVAFYGDTRDLLAAHKDMRRREIDWLAIYHSHPLAPPVPSKTDGALAYTPEVMSLIIGPPGTAPQVRAWWITTEDFHEAEWELID
jgi:[CysO sulfur-carrier protein]-S-L-cysteine hydrolase